MTDALVNTAPPKFRCNALVAESQALADEDLPMGNLHLLRVRLGGEFLGIATIEQVMGEDDEPIFSMTTDEGDESISSDYQDARDDLALTIRGWRENRLYEIEDARKDEARDLLESMLDNGRAAELVKILRAIDRSK